MMKRGVFLTSVIILLICTFCTNRGVAQEGRNSSLNLVDATLEVDTTTAGPGSVNNLIHVSMSNNVPVYGVQFRLTYNPNELAVVNVDSTARTELMSFFAWNEPIPGSVEVVVLDIFRPISIGNGPIIDFYFDVLPNARCSENPLVLSDVMALDNLGTPLDVNSFNGLFIVSVPGVEISLSATDHDFGLVNQGEPSHWYLKIYNVGTLNLNISNIIADPADYSVDRTNFTVSPCDSEQVRVTFTPSAGGAILGTVTINSNDPDEPSSVINVTGTGCEPPEIDVDSASINFGFVTIGESEDATITVYNLGCQTLNVVDVDVTGADADQFTVESGDAPFSVLGGQSHNIELRFTPTSCGEKNAQLEIDSNDLDEGTIIVPLTGEATSLPNIDVDPTTVDFGFVNVGSVIDTTITVHNTGCQDLIVNDVSLEGPDAGQFSIVLGGEPFTLLHGEAHTIEVQFEPTSGGLRKGMSIHVLAKNATLRLQSNDPDENVKDIPLTGTGCEDPDIQVDPTAIDFGVVNIPQSKDTTIVVSNDNCQTLEVTETNLVGADPDEFAIIGGAAPFSVPTGGIHTISIQFIPSSDGTKNATLEIVNNAPGKSPTNVALSGDGCSPPDISVIPDSWDYGVVNVGLTEDKIFVVSNTGCRVLQVTATNLVGDDPDQFSIVAGLAPFSVAPGGTENITVRFEPTTGGSKSAILQVTSNDPDEGTVNIDLAGGVCGLQDIAVDPDSWDYGPVSLGQNENRTFVVSNVGCQDLTVTGMAIVGPDAGEFSIMSGGGGITLAQGETRDVVVQFSPASGGNKNAILQIASDDPDEDSLNVGLTGEGCEPPDIDVEPLLWDFNVVNEGAFEEKIFFVSNDSCQTLHVTSTTIEGSNPEFTIVSGGAPFDVVQSGTHNIVVRLTPDSGGHKDAVLRIVSNDPDEDTLDVPLSGEGCAYPDIVVEPISADFGVVDGGQVVDTTFTVSNDSCQTLKVSSASLHGAAAAEFAIDLGGSGFDVPQGGEDFIVVSFRPKSPGAKNAILRIASNDPDEGTKDIPLSGFGNAPDIQLSATSHNYGNVDLGDFADWVLVVNNVGNQNLIVNNIATNKVDFIVTSPTTFPVVINAAGNLNITIRFAPSAGGNRVANLTITSNDPDEQIRNVSLTGVGCVLPDIDVNPSSWNYGQVDVDGFEDKTFVISNDGCQNLDVSAPSITGVDASHFTIISGGGPFTLGDGETRNVVIRFTPQTGGARTATLEIVSNDPDELTVIVNLQGEGCVDPNIVVYPSTWDFGLVNVGGFSDITIIVSNTGCQDLVVSGASIVGANTDQFSIQSGGDGFTLSSGQTQNIEVRFTPTSGGVKNAGLQILSNDPNEGGVIVTLTGQGCALQDIAVTPTAWSYGIVDVGGFEENTFSVSNEGCQDLEVTGTSIVGTNSDEFSIMSGGGASTIPGDGSIDIVVRFAPTSTGSKSATLRIQSNDPDEGTFDVELTGGVCGLPDIDVEPETWNYGSVAVDDQVQKEIIVSNTGCQDLQVSATALVGANADQYTIVSGGGAFAVIHGATRGIIVRFSPDSPGTKSAGLRITSNDPDEGIVTVPLNGLGCGDPDIAVDPMSWGFGEIDVGGFGDRIIEISNLGCQTLQVTATNLTGINANEFDIVSGGAPFSIAQGGKHNIVLQFSPESGGDKSATLEILSNDPNEGKVSVILTGSGCVVPDISLNLLFWNFGVVDVGKRADKTIVVSNTGCQDLQVTATTIVGTNPAEFQIVSGGGFFTVERGETHNIVVRFIPTSGGPKDASLRISSNDPDEGITEVPLTGEGCGFSDIDVDFTSWDFNIVDVGDYKEKIVVVSNSGCQNLQVTNTAIVGSDPNQFSIVAGGGGFTVSQGQTHDILVRFTPTAGGGVSAVLQISSDDPDESIKNVSLTGEGCSLQDVSINPTSWNYGTVDIGDFADRTFVVSNVGCQVLQVTGVALVGIDTDQFSIVAGDGSFSLVQGETRNIIVRFVPTSGGSKTVTLQITSNDPDEPLLEAALSGGVCLGPDIGVNPDSWDFSTVNVSQHSDKSIIVSNTGCQNLEVSATNTIGPDAGSFTVVSGGGVFTILQGETHVIVVRFAPLSGGNKSATLQIVSNDPDEGTKNVQLEGTGCSQPNITLDPLSWNYGQVAVGEHADKTFVMSNDGCQDLVVSGMAIVGPDAEQYVIVSGGGAFTVVQGGSHSIVVRFSPTDGGTKSATLQIHSNDPDQEEFSVSLSGGALTPEIELSTTNHNFAGAPIGQEQRWILEISNVGDGDLIVSSITSDREDFSISYPTFPQTVSPTKFLSVVVVFTPSVSGLINGSLNITSNDIDEQILSVTLSGLGLVPDIELSATRHDFGGVAVGGANQWTLTISNSGTGDLNVTDIILDNEVFTVDVTSLTIASGGSQLVTVTFSPTAEGFTSGQLTIRSSDPDEPIRSVVVTGEGLVPDIEVVTSHNFGNVPVGNFAEWMMTISNMGTGTLIVSGIGSDNADFTAAPTNFTIMPGGSHDVVVTFTPSQGGAISSQITVVSNDPDEQVVTVFVMGNGLVPDINLPVPSYDFGGVPVGESKVWNMIIQNLGTGDLIITEITSNSTDFIVTATGFILASGASQTVEVTFHPSVTGALAAQLSISSSDPDEPTVLVDVAGLGLVPDIDLSATSHDFEGVPLDQSDDWVLTVFNVGTGALQVTEIRSSNADFRVDITAFSVTPGGSRNVTVTFTPSIEGSISGQLTIFSDDPDEPSMPVMVSGEGLVPDIEIPNASNDFGRVDINTTKEWILLIENVGGADLIVTDVRSDNAAFTVAPPSLPFVIGPKSSQGVPVTFAPTDRVSYEGRLTITTANDPDEPEVSVSLTGVGDGVSVQLNSFTGLAHEGHVLLRWTTGAAKGCLGFHIYRSRFTEGGYGRLSESLIQITDGAYSYRDKPASGEGLYYYRLKAVDLNGCEQEVGLVSVKVTGLTPDDFGLSQNYPNPFNPETCLMYTVPEGGRVRLDIYNTLGQRVRTLVDEHQSSGRYTVFWEGRDDLEREVSTGVYFAILQAGPKTDKKKMVLLK